MRYTERLPLILALSLLAAVMAFVPALAADNGDSVGLADQTTGIWYLRGDDGSTTSFFFGNPGDYPIMGDWDCDGVDTPGLYRQSDGYVYLRNSNTQGPADIRFFFGDPGDIPLAGDFDGDGCDSVSIYRPAEARIFVINKLGANDGGLGAAAFDFYFGNQGDKPFTADFNNDGVDTVGLHRESTGFVYYRNTLTTGVADNDFFFGDPGDQIISGRWVQNLEPGPDTVGIFRPSQGRFYLRFSNSQGNADVDMPYGNADMAAVAGDFGSLPGGDPAPPGNPGDTTPTTTSPVTGAEHPQSGDGWNLAGCSNPTGTCTYSQAAESYANIVMHYPPLPSDYRNCLRWGLYGCEGGWQYISQWAFSWYDPAGSQMFPSSCQTLYDSSTGLKSGASCSVSIAGKPLGEYRGELCFKPYGSSTCTADLLTVYFNVHSTCRAAGRPIGRMADATFSYLRSRPVAL